MYTKKSVKHKFGVIALLLAVFLAGSFFSFLSTSVSAAAPTAQWADQYDINYGSSTYGFATGWYYNSVNDTVTLYEAGSVPLSSPYQYFTNNDNSQGLCSDMVLYNPANPSHALYFKTTSTNTSDMCNVDTNSLVTVSITDARPGGEPPSNGVTAQWENSTEILIAVDGSPTDQIFEYTSSSNNNMTLTLAKGSQSPGNTVCQNQGTFVVDNYAAKGNHSGTLTNYDVITNSGTDTGCGAQTVPLTNAWPVGTIGGSCVLPNGDNGTIGPGGLCQANGSTTSTSSDSCPIDSSDSLRWLLCPIFDIGKIFTNALNNVMQTLLYTPTQQIFGTNSYCTYSTGPNPTCNRSGTTSFQPVFNTFRDIGLALLVIAGLVMVVSQAAGMEIFAAYTVRKALPRIVIAMIGLALAWPLLQYTVTFFDDLGVWISQLILITTHISTGSNPNAPLIGIEAGVMGSIFAIGVGLVIGAAGIISLIGTVALALFVGFLVLSIRQLVVLVCILVAPLAIASYVLPGTKRMWDFWSDTLIRALMMFPIIMAFLSAGAAFAAIAGAAGASALANHDTGHELAWDLMALISYFAPYFLLPFAFTIAGGLLATLHGAVNNRHQGAFAALRGVRQKERERIHQERMEGKTVGGSGVVGGLYRRTFTRGGFNLTRAGRNRYSGSEKQRLGAIAAKGLETEAGFGSGDTAANALAAQEDMTRSKFITEYMKTGNAGQPATREQAEAALGNLEGSYKARLGTDTMRRMAFQARTLDPTGYAPTDKGLMELGGDAASMVRSGLITTTQATAAIKANRARADQSGVGFGEWLKVLNEMSTGRGRAMTETDVVKLRQSALEATQPGAFIGGRPETVTALSGTLLQNLQAAISEGNQDKIDTQLAQISAIHTVMQQAAPKNARIFADEVMGKRIMETGSSETDTKVSTVLTQIEAARARKTDEWGSQRFAELERNYSSSYAREAAEEQARRGFTGVQSGPPMQPPTIGGG